MELLLLRRFLFDFLSLQRAILSTWCGVFVFFFNTTKLTEVCWCVCAREKKSELNTCLLSPSNTHTCQVCQNSDCTENYLIQPGREGGGGGGGQMIAMGLADSRLPRADSTAGLTRADPENSEPLPPLFANPEDSEDSEASETVPDLQSMSFHPPSASPRPESYGIVSSIFPCSLAPFPYHKLLVLKQFYCKHTIHEHVYARHAQTNRSRKQSGAA